jgi:hypothetical protein
MRLWPGARDLLPWLAPLDGILQNGNTAMNWLSRHKNGESISSLIGTGATAMENEEIQEGASLKAKNVSPGAVINDGYLG